MRTDAVIEAIAVAAEAWSDPDHPDRHEAVERTLAESGHRFTEEALAFTVNQAMAEARSERLAGWLDSRATNRPLRMGVIEAGNVPLAGLQDYMAVLLTGHQFVGRVSKRSPHLLPAFAAEVRRAGGPEAIFVDGDTLFGSVDGVIASGSDETRDEIEQRCVREGLVPDRLLLRGNRFGVAVLDGRESEDERLGLAEDALLHEGLGCRNVAVVWAPSDLDPDPVLEAFAVFRGTFPVHPSTAGSLKMQHAFLRAVDQPHAHAEDLSFLVSRGDPEVQAPGHVRWVPYEDASEAETWIREHAGRIQLVSARAGVVERLPMSWAHCELGTAQRPPLDWRPDGIDTIAFLAGL